MSENTDIIKSEENAGITMSEDVQLKPICTVDPNDNKGKFKILNAINGAESLNNHMYEPLKICDCITEPGSRRGRNNMPDTACINTYLIDVDGNAYFSQSDGVARSVYTINTLWSDFGKSTDEGYLLLQCVEKTLSNGNTIKNIIQA